jgi:hypothetical protein
MMRYYRVIAAVWMVLTTMGSAQKEIACALDGLLVFPQVWEMTPEQLETQFGGQGGRSMKWLTTEKSRAKFSRHLYSNLEINLTLIEGQVPIEEAVVDFSAGKVNVITLSIYNRGDGGVIAKEEFERRFKLCGAAISKGLQVKPAVSRADRQQGLLSEGYRWASVSGLALLEHNEGALAAEPREFLRLRISKKGAAGGLAASMVATRGGAAVKLSELPANVRKEADGSVIVSGVPMVDQGNKGYCVCASVQRLFEYYGLGADMHQIAAISGADPEKGTNTVAMAEELDKIDYRFKTRLKIIGMLAQSGGLVQVEKEKDRLIVGKPVDEAAFLKAIRSHVNDGLPLLWSLELGQFKETPDLNPQAGGGHMRLVIGYNDRDKTVIFSDSWGAGHERKTMSMADAFQATRGLFVLQPTVR